MCTQRILFLQSNDAEVQTGGMKEVTVQRINYVRKYEVTAHWEECLL